MSKKNCQRCDVPFECLVEDIRNCSCYDVSLSSESETYLAKTNFDCLCTPCLNAINDLLENIAIDEQTQIQLEDGKDYYMERDFMVFTEYYHIKRGYCCKSKCRHCAYGYNTKS